MRLEAGADRLRRDPPARPRGQRRPGLHRRDRLDAHVLAGQDVDRAGWTRCARRCCTCTPRPTSTLPWDEIDMDFMNLNQAAHGDREFGYIQTRLGVARKTVVGSRVRPGGDRSGRRPGSGRRSAGPAIRRLKLARFGDNMRDVAVTEGDKVEAELQFGVSVNTYGVNDLVAVVDADRRRRVDAAGRRVRRSLRPRPGAGAGRRPARVAALRRPDRGRPAGVPRPTAASAPSPPTSRTWAACGSCPGSRSSG